MWRKQKAEAEVKANKPTDADLLEQIRTLDAHLLTTGRDADGVPYLRHVFRLYQSIFGEPCTHCPSKIAGYIRKLKNHNKKSSTMSDAKKSAAFQLQPGVTLPVRGTGEHYSNANLTDEAAIKLLAENPKRKQLFVKLPANVDELIDAEKAKKMKVKTAKAASEQSAQKAPKTHAKKQEAKKTEPKKEPKAASEQSAQKAEGNDDQAAK